MPWACGARGALPRGCPGLLGRRYRVVYSEAPGEPARLPRWDAWRTRRLSVSPGKSLTRDAWRTRGHWVSPRDSLAWDAWRTRRLPVSFASVRKEVLRGPSAHELAWTG